MTPQLARRAWLYAFTVLALLCTVAVHAAPVGAPGLRWRAADGSEADAPAHSLDVSYRVSGLVAEAVVKQQFRNDGTTFLEGQYLLPLPDGAAVHTLKLRIGQRVIEGEIREREQARAEYRAAAAAGQRTSLVEQHQGNVFRTAVANVAPGETVEVEIGYWQRVRYQDGAFNLVFPLTFVEPYAISGTAPSDPTLTAPTPVSYSVPTVSIQVELEPGLPLQSVLSDTHSIDVQREGSGYRIALADKKVPADRDFVLSWRPEPQAKPTAALFVEQTADAAYAMVMMLAPEQQREALPRELILVIDTSGSMLGSSLDQAKAALDAALQRLSAKDRFNVIQFNSVTEPLFKEPVAATPDSIQVAREWVSLLEATGGTEMLPALSAAFVGTPPQGYVRQVVFATDGAVTGEGELYNVIEREIGAARLFPVGIGDAPNAQFLSQAARMGRGADVVVRDINAVAGAMQSLFDKLDRPALRDVAMTWPGVAESYPTQMPDLYAGEPLMAVARIERADGEVAASGLLKDNGWSKSLALKRTRSDEGIARLWARAKIDDLQDDQRRGADAATIRQQIIELALAHRLVTPYTSLIAVDKTPVRPSDATLNGVDPQADGDALAMAQGATPAPLMLLIGLAGLALVALSARPSRRFAKVRA
jgi:Ca-activated chloride channel homolog